MADPGVISSIIQNSQRFHADPAAMLATSLVENNGRMQGFGDQGTSAGPFMMHQGGALGSHSFAWAQSPAAIAERAQQFGRLGIHGGRGAAALQRPADPLGYAQKVDARLGEAKSLLAQYGAGGASTPTPTQTLPTAGGAQAQQSGTLRFDAGPSNLGLARFTQFANQAATQRGLPQTAMPDTPHQQITVPLWKATGASLTASDHELGALPSHVAGHAQKAIQLARAYMGTPYKWGGADPKTGFDCSGLIQYVYKQAGVNLPRTAQEQFNVGTPIDRQHLAAGDAVFFRDSSGIHHVGLYIGGGSFINAHHTGDVVKVASLNDSYYASQFAGGRRFG